MSIINKSKHDIYFKKGIKKMKKRLKLFSTIASLCLAVALMAFGVWAATNATFGVTSTVKYTVNGQVNVEFGVTVAYGEDVTLKRDDTERDPATSNTDSETKITTDSWSISQVPGESAKTQTLKLGEYTFNSKALDGKSKIVYTITITNNAAEKLKVTLSNGVTATTTEQLTTVVIKCEVEETGLNAEKMVAGKTGETAGVYTYKVTYTLNKGIDSADITFNPSFALEAQQE